MDWQHMTAYCVTLFCWVTLKLTNHSGPDSDMALITLASAIAGFGAVKGASQNVRP